MSEKKSALERSLENLEELLQDENLSFDKGFEIVNKNYTTKRDYKGFYNNFVLAVTRSVKGYRFPYWLGYKQAMKAGIPVRKGESGTGILYRVVRKNYFDENGYDVDSAEEADGYTESVFYNLGYVFNVEQTNADIETINTDMFTDKTPKELEAVLNNYVKREGIKLLFNGDIPCYIYKEDTIQLVPQELFCDNIAYYEAFAHECMHSTGHKDRLDRDLDDKSKYNDEEVIAEFGTMVLMSMHGIHGRERDMACYIKSYMKEKKDIKSIFHLCNQSQQGVNYIIGDNTKNEKSSD